MNYEESYRWLEAQGYDRDTIERDFGTDLRISRATGSPLALVGGGNRTESYLVEIAPRLSCQNAAYQSQNSSTRDHSHKGPFAIAHENGTSQLREYHQ